MAGGEARHWGSWTYGELEGGELEGGELGGLGAL